MGFKLCQQGGKKQLLSAASSTLREPFRILTATLLSLLLPVSFLVLARLSTAHYLFTLSHKPHPSSLLISLFLYTNPTLLHLLVSLVSFAVLVHGLTGWIPLISKSTEPVLRSRLYAAWILLCTFQVCVGLAVEGSIAAGIDGSVFGHERSTNLISRVMFFWGLHETMLYWSRMVVKPVVDDTVFGFVKEERWVERVAMAAGFDVLWWWRLRDEVELLVVMVEVKKELSMGIGVADFVGWWLYYQTLTIGMVRIVKGIVWVGVILLFRRRVEATNPGDSRGNEDKV